MQVFDLHVCQLAGIGAVLCAAGSGGASLLRLDADTSSDTMQTSTLFRVDRPCMLVRPLGDLRGSKASALFVPATTETLEHEGESAPWDPTTVWKLVGEDATPERFLKFGRPVVDVAVSEAGRTVVSLPGEVYVFDGPKLDHMFGVRVSPAPRALRPPDIPVVERSGPGKPRDFVLRDYRVSTALWRPAVSISGRSMALASAGVLSSAANGGGTSSGSVAEDSVAALVRSVVHDATAGAFRLGSVLARVGGSAAAAVARSAMATEPAERGRPPRPATARPAAEEDDELVAWRSWYASLHEGSLDAEDGVSSSGAVAVVDVCTGDVLASWTAHGGNRAISALALSASATALLTCDELGQVLKLWRVLPPAAASGLHGTAGRRLLAKLERGFTPAPVRCCSLSADAAIASCVSGNDTVHVWPVGARTAAIGKLQDGGALSPIAAASASATPRGLGGHHDEHRPHAASGGSDSHPSQLIASGSVAIGSAGDGKEETAGSVWAARAVGADAQDPRALGHAQAAADDQTETETEAGAESGMASVVADVVHAADRWLQGAEHFGAPLVSVLADRAPAGPGSAPDGKAAALNRRSAGGGERTAVLVPEVEPPCLAAAYRVPVGAGGWSATGSQSAAAQEQSGGIACLQLIDHEDTRSGVALPGCILVASSRAGLLHCVKLEPQPAIPQAEASDAGAGLAGLLKAAVVSAATSAMASTRESEPSAQGSGLTAQAAAAAQIASANEASGVPSGSVHRAGTANRWRLSRWSIEGDAHGRARGDADEDADEEGDDARASGLAGWLPLYTAPSPAIPVWTRPNVTLSMHCGPLDADRAAGAAGTIRESAALSIDQLLGRSETAPSSVGMPDAQKEPEADPQTISAALGSTWLL
jgi:hypothetical protein